MSSSDWEGSGESRTFFRISQINRKIAETLESAFSSIWLKGELSNFIAHSSGHWYFSLKEEEAQIKGVMFRGSNQKLSFHPENGQELIVKGRISVYAPRGVYQIICEEMELSGAGALQKSFEELKEKLKKEGLFDSEHKKPIPPLPSHIAVITSPTGAAVRDILNVLRRRFKGVKVTVIPALVQGTEAPKSLIAALGQAEALSPDTIIIGRGGGSLEDLWAFNDENLARAIDHCSMPVISAVGHEIDFTICDFTADLRAPTPSAAAELVAQNGAEILQRVENFQGQLVSQLKFHINFWKEKVSSLESRVRSPERLIRELSQKLDDWSRQIVLSVRHGLEKDTVKLSHLEKLLKSLNPTTIMKRGFCIVRKENRVIKSSQDLNLKETVSLEFFKGRASALITGKNPD